MIDATAVTEAVRVTRIALIAAITAATVEVAFRCERRFFTIDAVTVAVAVRDWANSSPLARLARLEMVAVRFLPTDLASAAVVVAVAVRVTVIPSIASINAEVVTVAVTSFPMFLMMESAATVQDPVSVDVADFVTVAAAVAAAVIAWAT